MSSDLKTPSGLGCWAASGLWELFLHMWVELIMQVVVGADLHSHLARGKMEMGVGVANTTHLAGFDGVQGTWGGAAEFTLIQGTGGWGGTGTKYQVPTEGVPVHAHSLLSPNNFV
mmetsp:Transcript_15190/g.26920  ORF Transcript_15190/g.26920 Transcript_15190/m.26920 type:complete len:115 (-) Transcript_15190:1909-2253(-)